MAFTFRAEFAGVLAMVPDRELDDNPTKVCVLMPNAGKPYGPSNGRTAVDSSILRPHVSLLKYKVADCPDHPSLPAADAETIWYLDGLRITFAFERVARQKRAVGLEAIYTKSWDESDTLPEDEAERSKALSNKGLEDLSWIPDLRKIVGDEDAKPDPALFDPTSVDPRLAALVSIETGSLKTDLFSERLWSLDTLTGRELSKPMGVSLVVEVPDLAKATIISAPLGKPGESATREAHRLDLVAQPGKDSVRVQFYTSCLNNPLAWELLTGDAVAVREDRDFLWHYEFLTKKARDRMDATLMTVRRARGEIRIVPYVHGEPGALGRDNNCIVGRLAPYEDLP
ncbi:MAG TPA: hypothetical protein VF017_09045 [Thermoanaerobaculia bacterium]|nr:hypothetical protein [Thermoanaerobaculia bacterium]